ncbi:MAG TPA: protein translocase subunit SecD [Dongiaceae bacterium]|jgi:protein-export membrane protein SecD|nr:protein translocase subunit SecD [Dongiaceae bacterium]
MLYFAPWKVILIAVLLALGTLMALPNFLPSSAIEKLPDFFPKRRVNLGLDLQGGSHLLFEVDVDALVKERLANAVDDVRGKLRGGNVGYTDLGVRNGEVNFSLRDPAQAGQARSILGPALQDMTLAIGADGHASARFTEAAITQMKTHAVEQSIEIIRRRIDETGTREPTIIRQGEDRILVQLPGLKDPQHVKNLIGKTAKLSFRLVNSEASAAGPVPAGSEALPMAENDQVKLVVQNRVMVSGENLIDAQQAFQDNIPVVSFRFDGVGARRFGEATSKNVGRPFAIVLDGKVISAPRINEPILGGAGIISGSFSIETARDLALLLRAGALPAPLTVLEERTVGADLGADSIEAGKRACIIGVLLIVVAMVLLYGFFGIIANIALVLNAVLLFAALSFLEATLTLPGIAGIVLTLGMAVDANVLILERVKEEIRHGRSPISAMETGYREAQATIVDANVTTLISTLFLFFLGTGPVKGFAVTLSIGILTSVFTAVVVTRLMTSVWLKRARPKLLPL